MVTMSTGPDIWYQEARVQSLAKCNLQTMSGWNNPNHVICNWCVAHIADCILHILHRLHILSTRSLGALRAPTSSSRPFGPLDLSFAPFGRSGQGTHASYIDYIRCFDYIWCGKFRDGRKDEQGDSKSRIDNSMQWGYSRTLKRSYVPQHALKYPFYDTCTHRSYSIANSCGFSLLCNIHWNKEHLIAAGLHDHISFKMGPIILEYICFPAAPNPSQTIKYKKIFSLLFDSLIIINAFTFMTLVSEDN